MEITIVPTLICVQMQVKGWAHSLSHSRHSQWMPAVITYEAKLSGMKPTWVQLEMQGSGEEQAILILSGGMSTGAPGLQQDFELSDN